MKSDENSKLQTSAIEQNLELSYEQRLDAHEKARILVEDLKIAGEQVRARSKTAS